MKHCITICLAALALAACAQLPPEPVGATGQTWPRPDTHCASDTILLDAQFETGNLGKCSVEGDGSFTLALIPEDEPPINPSAWFAFRASGQPGDEVRVRLELDHG